MQYECKQVVSRISANSLCSKAEAGGDKDQSNLAGMMGVPQLVNAARGLPSPTCEFSSVPL